MSDVRLSPRAFIKPLLHAAKYPHCSVNGLFLAEANKQKDGKTSLQIKDSIPLFHSNLTLAPMMEVALWQVDAFCQRNNLVIAGYYQANENISDTSLTGVACHVANKIKENFSDAFLAMIDNEHAVEDCDNPYILHSNADGKWKRSDKRISAEKETIEAAAALLHSRTFRDLVDFDCHLNDISLEWRNLYVNDQIEQFV